jgi:hypothetical protein
MSESPGFIFVLSFSAFNWLARFAKPYWLALALRRFM